MHSLLFASYLLFGFLLGSIQAGGGGPACNCVHPDPVCTASSSTCGCGELSCDYSACCSSRRRRLQESRKLDADEYQFWMDSCSEFEYEAALYVDSHLYAVVSPSQLAVEYGCLYAAMHVEYHESTGFEKELLVWDNQEAFSHVFDEQGMFTVGSFQLVKLMKAYEETEPNTSQYDVVANSCANYMIDLARNLGLKIDSHVSAFVARRLLEQAGGELLEQIKSSKKFWTLVGGESRRLGRNSMSETELLELVVEENARILY